uniref:holo-[acyl-carrier-protein] synthase n=1 Tax=Anthurium amnicola TaxID=1678845 RepID=A0A1D1ZFA5_9ARAE
MEGAVRRWLVDISQWDPSPEQFSFFVSLLPKYEQSAITRFIKLDDRKRALVSRLLQYSLVHEVLDMPYDEINIRRTIEGKPYLLQNNCRQNIRYPNFNFNVSHSGNYVGIASEPVCLVGLDIVSDVVFQRESSPDFVNDFSSHFTHLEWKNIINAGSFSQILKEFYRYWSLKEAFVKALGIGLGFKLNRLEFHHMDWTNISVYVDGKESRDWKFWLFDLDERHWASIAKGHPRNATESYRCTLMRTNIEDEEHCSWLALPNTQFVLRWVDELVPHSANDILGICGDKSRKSLNAVQCNSSSGS